MNPVLVQLAVRSTLPLLVSNLAGLILRRSHAARHAIYTVGLVAAIIAPWLPQLELLPSAAAPLPLFSSPATQGMFPHPGLGKVGIAPASNAPDLLLALYIAVTAVLLLRGILDRLQLSLTARRSSQTRDGNIRVIIWGQASPASWGVFRPTIAVPVDFPSWSADLQSIAMHHERAHLSRRDPAWSLLIDLITAILWFHPLAWLTRHQARLASEMACDATVLQHGVSPAHYAESLMSLAVNVPYVAAHTMAAKSALPARVSALFVEPRRGRAAMGISLLALVGTCLQLGHAQTKLGNEPLVAVSKNGRVVFPDGAAYRVSKVNSNRTRSWTTTYGTGTKIEYSAWLLGAIDSQAGGAYFSLALTSTEYKPDFGESEYLKELSPLPARQFENGTLYALTSGRIVGSAWQIYGGLSKIIGVRLPDGVRSTDLLIGRPSGGWEVAARKRLPHFTKDENPVVYLEKPLPHAGTVITVPLPKRPADRSKVFVIDSTGQEFELEPNSVGRDGSMSDYTIQEGSVWPKPGPVEVVVKRQPYIWAKIANIKLPRG